MDLEVLDATEADVPRLIDVYFSAFNGDPYMESLDPGYKAPETRAKTVEQARERMLKRWRAADATSRFIKVVDRATGQIAGMASWRIFEHERPEAEWKQRPEIDWLQGRQREIAQAFRNVNAEAGEKLFGGKPHILLGLLCIHKDFQRRGAGTLLMQWGIRLSENTGLSIHLVASPEGRELYRKLGFHEVEVVVLKAADWDGDYDFPMAVMQKDPQDKSSLAVKGELVADAK